MAEPSYHDDVRYTTKSQLWTFSQSRTNYYQQFVSGEADRKQVGKQANFGTIVHDAAIMAGDIDDLAVAYPDECYCKDKDGNVLDKLNGSAAKKFREEIAPKFAFKADEIESMRRCVQAINSSWVGSAIAQATHREDTFLAQGPDFPVACKCRVDIGCYDDKTNVFRVVDLKVSDPQPDQFRRSASRFGYWLQQAHYSAIIEHVFGCPVEWCFAVAEPTAPHRIAKRWYSEDSMRLARVAHMNMLRDLAQCRETGDWRDAWDGPIPVSSWEMGVAGQELVGVEDWTDD